MKTKDERNEMLEKLSELQKKVNDTEDGSSSGVDVKIKVIKDDMDEDAIFAKWDGDDLEHAILAIEWLNDNLLDNSLLVI